MLKLPSMARALLVSGGVGVIWLVLAWRNPSLTYHFAPLIGAAVGPLSLRTQGQADSSLANKTGGIVLAFMLGITLLLELAGRQEGPNFLEMGPAWPEAVLFSAIGVFVGVRAASRENPGLLGRLVDSTV